MFKLWDLIKPREPLLGFTVQIIVKHSPLTWKLDHFEFRYPPLGELNTIIHQLYEGKKSCETCINTVLTLHQLCTLDMARLKSHMCHISVNTVSSVHSSKHYQDRVKSASCLPDLETLIHQTTKRQQTQSKARRVL